jgi:hypothetical protein
MADGTGDDGSYMGLYALKELATNMAYLRAKMSHEGVQKSLVWSRSGMAHYLRIGDAKGLDSDFVTAISELAFSVSQGDDGAAPSLADYSAETSLTLSQQKEVYATLQYVAAKVMMDKRIFVMHPGDAKHRVEIYIGSAEAGSVNWRKGLQGLMTQFLNGLG